MVFLFCIIMYCIYLKVKRHQEPKLKLKSNIYLQWGFGLKGGICHKQYAIDILESLGKKEKDSTKCHFICCIFLNIGRKIILLLIYRNLTILKLLHLYKRSIPCLWCALPNVISIVIEQSFPIIHKCSSNVF